MNTTSIGLEETTTSSQSHSLAVSQAHSQSTQRPQLPLLSSLYLFLSLSVLLSPPSLFLSASNPNCNRNKRRQRTLILPSTFSLPLPSPRFLPHSCLCCVAAPATCLPHLMRSLRACATRCVLFDLLISGKCCATLLHVPLCPFPSPSVPPHPSTSLLLVSCTAPQILPSNYATVSLLVAPISISISLCIPIPIPVAISICLPSSQFPVPTSMLRSMRATT